MSTLPLFPLNTVLFPGGPLKLRIFETRYVDMISRCMREGTGFGVAMIVDGVEAGGPARTAKIGTHARIVDFEQLKDGLLGITARGERRFRVLDTTQQADALNVADVEWLEEAEAQPVPLEFAGLVDLLRDAWPRLTEFYADLQAEFDDAAWVGARLAEILPIPNSERQGYLELDDPMRRLRLLQERMGLSKKLTVDS